MALIDSVHKPLSLIQIWDLTKLKLIIGQTKLIQGGQCWQPRKKSATELLFSLESAQVLIYRISPSSIYSCSIDYFLEHEICHLGCLGRNKKFLKRPNFCLSMQLFRVVFSTFWLSIEQLYIELGYFSVRIQKLHNIAGLSEAGGPGGLSYKLKIGYHSRFFGPKSWV